MKIGLVLGGGGAAGTAYHCGALAALEHDLGWSPDDADVIVGTSAGSILGALLRLGVPATDLVAMAVDRHQAAVHPFIRERGITAAELERPGWRDLARPPRPISAAFWRRQLRRPWAFNPLDLVIASLPDGPVPLRPHFDALDAATGGRWPDKALWVCAARQDDLEPVVLGRDGPTCSLADAVAASCAVPGWFSPVPIHGRPHVDGGVTSPTNADLLAGLGLDLVIVLSPMSAERLSGPRMAMRRYADQHLRREVLRLRASGTPVVALAPSPDVLAHTPASLMDTGHLADIALASFLSTGRQLLDPANLELLPARPSRPPTPGDLGRAA